MECVRSREWSRGQEGQKQQPRAECFVTMQRQCEHETVNARCVRGVSMVVCAGWCVGSHSNPPHAASQGTGDSGQAWYSVCGCCTCVVMVSCGGGLLLLLLVVKMIVSRTACMLVVWPLRFLVCRRAGWCGRGQSVWSTENTKSEALEPH